MLSTRLAPATVSGSGPVESDDHTGGFTQSPPHLRETFPDPRCAVQGSISSAFLPCIVAQVEVATTAIPPLKMRYPRRNLETPAISAWLGAFHRTSLMF